jgi:glycosyltransferase involved in cell wall biosynthesis
MHVALLANTAWLDEELPLFQHLVVGLIDEQVRVAQVVPEGRLGDEASVFGEIVFWRDAGWRWTRRRSLYQLDQVLDGLGVNLIHALDGRLWRGATELGRRISAPVIYSSFSALDVPLAARLAPRLDPTRALFTAASDPLAGELRRVLPEAFNVERLRTGIHKQSPEHEGGEDEIVSIVVAGNGRLDAAVSALLHGATALVRDCPQTHLFFDGQGADQRDVWREAKKLGLLSHASFIPRRLGHRELLLRADVLVHPQTSGRMRGLTLQAMAHGLPVVARQDPMVDHLIDGETARVLDHPTAADWQQTLAELVNDPSDRRSLGLGARQWVNQHRLASTSVAQALHAYRTLTGATLAFEAA